jgi:hypothetical protein
MGQYGVGGFPERTAEPGHEHDQFLTEIINSTCLGDTFTSNFDVVTNDTVIAQAHADARICAASAGAGETPRRKKARPADKKVANKQVATVSGGGGGGGGDCDDGDCDVEIEGIERGYSDPSREHAREPPSPPPPPPLPLPLLGANADTAACSNSLARTTAKRAAAAVATAEEKKQQQAVFLETDDRRGYAGDVSSRPPQWTGELSQTEAWVLGKFNNSEDSMGIRNHSVAQSHFVNEVAECFDVSLGCDDLASLHELLAAASSSSSSSSASSPSSSSSSSQGGPFALRMTSAV